MLYCKTIQETKLHVGAFNAFKKSLCNTSNAALSIGADSPVNFAKKANVPEEYIQSQLSSKIPCKKSLFISSRNKTVPTFDLCLEILAWGGMGNGLSLSNAKRFFSEGRIKDFLELTNKIRQGSCNRSEAYDAFAKLSRDKKIKGLGPAFYTKLIFFLMPQNNYHPIGYIMDQWVGSSINLLAQGNIVLMNGETKWKSIEEYKTSLFVSNINTGDHYERYCSFIEFLARKIKKTPIETESYLISEGGRTPKPWREYVSKNRKIYPLSQIKYG